jgi:hypothetical protein
VVLAEPMRIYIANDFLIVNYSPKATYICRSERDVGLNISWIKRAISRWLGFGTSLGITVYVRLNGDNQGYCEY